jgi:hypothetical protein
VSPTSRPSVDVREIPGHLVSSYEAGTSDLSPPRPKFWPYGVPTTRALAIFGHRLQPKIIPGQTVIRHLESSRSAYRTGFTRLRAWGFKGSPPRIPFARHWGDPERSGGKPRCLRSLRR